MPTSFEIFMEHIRNSPEGIDTSAVIGRQCYEKWIKSRKSALKQPEESFRRALTAHICGADGRVPFPPDIEKTLVAFLRQNRKIWPCFNHLDNVRIGLNGFRAQGFHERKSLKLGAPGTPEANRAASKRKAKGSRIKRNGHAGKVKASAEHQPFQQCLVEDDQPKNARKQGSKRQRTDSESNISADPGHGQRRQTEDPRKKFVPESNPEDSKESGHFGRGSTFHLSALAATACACAHHQLDNQPQRSTSSNYAFAPSDPSLSAATHSPSRETNVTQFIPNCYLYHTFCEEVDTSKLQQQDCDGRDSQIEPRQNNNQQQPPPWQWNILPHGFVGVSIFDINSGFFHWCDSNFRLIYSGDVTGLHLSYVHPHSWVSIYQDFSNVKTKAFHITNLDITNFAKQQVQVLATVEKLDKSNHPNLVRLSYFIISSSHHHQHPHHR